MKLYLVLLKFIFFTKFVLFVVGTTLFLWNNNLCQNGCIVATGLMAPSKFSFETLCSPLSTKNRIRDTFFRCRQCEDAYAHECPYPKISIFPVRFWETIRELGSDCLGRQSQRFDYVAAKHGIHEKNDAMPDGLIYSEIIRSF